jgi:general L-amino acid transport system permease protein
MASTDQQSSVHKVPLWRNPTFRGLIFQVLLVLGLIAFGIYLVNNTLNNMEQRGITTGFDFLGNEAGFGILQSLIPYDETYSYGRTFFVGLLNTMLVAALGIFFATFLGFFMGVARLSKNWLVARVATVYIETFRNIPLLLQILFWYFAVLQPLPRPRDSLQVGESIFLNNRGLFFPKPLAEDGFGIVVVAFLIAIAAVVMIARWAHRRQEATGQQFPTGWVGLGLIVGLPLLVFLFAGAPMHLEYPELKGFNFRGGLEIIPELAALTLALSIYTGTFIAEAVRSGIQAVSHGQTEAAGALGLRPNLTLKLVDHSAGDACHRPAVDQPVPESDEELVVGDRDRLPGPRQRVRRHDAEPDRPGGRGHRDDHGRLPDDQSDDLAFMNWYNKRNGNWWSGNGVQCPQYTRPHPDLPAARRRSVGVHRLVAHQPVFFGGPTPYLTICCRCTSSYIDLRAATDQLGLHRRRLGRRDLATTATAAAPAGCSSARGLNQFMYGFYPDAEQWRVNLAWRCSSC